VAASDAAPVALTTVAYHASSATWLAAGANGTVLRSRDAAATWTTVASGSAPDFQALYVDDRTGAVLIGGEKGVVGISRDAGVSWQLTFIAMPEPATPIAGFERFDGGLIARSALGRFLVSHDDGASWDLMQASTNAFFTAA